MSWTYRRPLKERTRPQSQSGYSSLNTSIPYSFLRPLTTALPFPPRRYLNFPTAFIALKVNVKWYTFQEVGTKFVAAVESTLSYDIHLSTLDHPRIYKYVLFTIVRCTTRHMLPSALSWEEPTDFNTHHNGKSHPSTRN